MTLTLLQQVYSIGVSSKLPMSGQPPNFTLPNPSVEITTEHTVSSDIPIILSAIAGFFFPCHPLHRGTEVGFFLLCKPV